MSSVGCCRILVLLLGMNTESLAPIGHVLRHGETRVVTHRRSNATLLQTDPDAQRRRIDTYRMGFEMDGAATRVLSGYADRCIQTAFLVVAALVPDFDPFERMMKLEEVAKRAMNESPLDSHEDWFRRALLANLCGEDEILGNFPESSPISRIELSPGLVTSDDLRMSSFPTGEIWVAVTHADIAALLRRRQPSEINLWNMHAVYQFTGIKP